MDYANMKSLLENPEVQELLLVLGIFGRKNDSNNFTELCEYMDKMNQNLEGVMTEVSDMKEQLLQMNAKKFAKDSLLEIVETIGDNTQNMKARLYDIRQEIRDKSKEVVQEVINKGILGLCKMTEFLGIKDKLLSMRRSAENSLTKTEETVKRLEQAGNQAYKAMVDVKNIGRSLTAKDMADANPEWQQKIERIVTGPMRGVHTFFSVLLDQIDKATGRIDDLYKENVVRVNKMRDVSFAQEPMQEIVIRQPEGRQTINSVQNIDALLDVWDAQRHCIRADSSRLLPDKARVL